jgi:hypothetical protein
MPTRTILTGATLFAAGALLGWQAFPTAAQDKKPQSDAKSEPALIPVQLAERTMHRRAVEAVIWGMPAVNYDLMYQAAVREAKGDFNQVIYWSRLPDWKIQTLTQGEELDQDRAEQGLVRVPALLQPDGSVLRQDVETG